MFIHWQWMTFFIIATNVVVFLIVNLAGRETDADGNLVVIAFGHIPSVYNDIRELPDVYRIIPDEFYVLTVVTSAFLHADIWHLGGNMLFVWVFGDNVEDAMGHFKFLVFYIVCACAAAWFHAFVFPQSDAPLIGASGAAAGIVSAYLMLHPKMKVWVLFLSRIPLRLSAAWVLGGWILFQLFMFLSDSGEQVSWAAHIAGIATGMVLVGLLKRPDVPLFDRQILPPKSAEIAPGEVIHWGRRAGDRTKKV
jgi:membrane associated rhomboid family serine protease